jgi:hypothetical protein
MGKGVKELDGGLTTSLTTERMMKTMKKKNAIRSLQRLALISSTR